MKKSYIKIHLISNFSFENKLNTVRSREKSNDVMAHLTIFILVFVIKFILEKNL